MTCFGCALVTPATWPCAVLITRVSLWFSLGTCRYLVPGAEYEVVSLPADLRKKIEQELSSPDDELFAELQAEAGRWMIWDLVAHEI